MKSDFCFFFINPLGGFFLTGFNERSKRDVEGDLKKNGEDPDE
jgi:hypothetical protein